MCDYSLQNVKSRPAAVGDKLVTHNFGAGTRGFAAPESLEVAVCLLPGTEIAFPNGLLIAHRNFFGWPKRSVRYIAAIFRQINKQTACGSPGNPGSGCSLGSRSARAKRSSIKTRGHSGVPPIQLPPRDRFGSIPVSPAKHHFDVNKALAARTLHRQEGPP
jgi:hypothetical protein